MTLESEDENESFWNQLFDVTEIDEIDVIEYIEIGPIIMYSCILNWTYLALQHNDISKITSKEYYDIKSKWVKPQASYLQYLVKIPYKRIRSNYDLVSTVPDKLSSYLEYIFNHFTDSVSMSFSYSLTEDARFNTLRQSYSFKWTSTPCLSTENDVDYKAINFFNYLFSFTEKQMLYMFFQGPSGIPKIYHAIYTNMIVMSLEFVMIRLFDFRASYFKHYKQSDLSNFSKFKWCPDEYCKICYSEVPGVFEQKCCDIYFCYKCFSNYVNFQVRHLGKINIKCMAFGCDYLIPIDIIWYFLTEENRELYNVIKGRLVQSKTKKLCPNCLYPYELSIKEEKKIKSKFILLRKKLVVTCKNCGFSWCFLCQNIPHISSCVKKDVKDILLKTWAKQNRDFEFMVQKYIVRKARKCPKCKMLTERIQGCLHIDCTICGTDWCFDCGRRQTVFGVQHICTKKWWRAIRRRYD